MSTRREFLTQTSVIAGAIAGAAAVPLASAQAQPASHPAAGSAETAGPGSISDSTLKGAQAPRPSSAALHLEFSAPLWV